MEKSLYEQLGGTYQQAGDYLIPNITVSERPDSQIGHPMIGKYGRMRRSFLKEHNALLYNELVLTGKLFDHLLEIDKSCNERMETICTAMAQQEGVTEALKAADQLEWVRCKNSIRSRAEEIILTELVYA